MAGLAYAVAVYVKVFRLAWVVARSSPQLLVIACHRIEGGVEGVANGSRSLLKTAAGAMRLGDCEACMQSCWVLGILHWQFISWCLIRSGVYSVSYTEKAECAEQHSGTNTTSIAADSGSRRELQEAVWT